MNGEDQMKTLLNFAMLLIGACLFGFATLMLGWFILVPVAIGGLWAVAKMMSESSSPAKR